MMSSEDIDRSYGNSPYFFYNHYPEEEKEEKKEVEKHTPLRSKYIYKEDNIPEYPSAWKNVYLSKMQKTVWRNLFKFY